MSNEPDDPFELAARQRDSLASLARGPEPPSALEERVVARLRQRGLLGGRRRAARAAQLAGLLAAGVACFVCGLLFGQRSPEPPSGSRYLLLLERNPGEAQAGDAEIGRRVREYRDWARQAGSEAQVVGGEKLTEDDAFTLAGPDGAMTSRGTAELGGYFLVAAPDLERALAFARTCPHLRYGGRIVLQSVERLP